MAWENQSELTKYFRCSNGIAGGANNRFAPLERDLLSYCDCKRHPCVNVGESLGRLLLYELWEKAPGSKMLVLQTAAPPSV
jgi:hypothetical protein